MSFRPLLRPFDRRRRAFAARRASAEPSGRILWAACLPDVAVVAIQRDADPADLTVTLKAGWRAPAARLQRVGTPVARDWAWLVPFRLDPGFAGPAAELRLVARLGGETLRSEPVRFSAGAFAAVIEGIVDYRLVGWAAPLFETEGFELELLVDGVVAERAPPQVFRPDLMRITRQGGWNGFGFALPPGALDGQPHRFAVRAGSTEIAHPPWAARPTFHIDNLEPRRLTGWFFDPGLVDRPSTMSLVAEGRERSRQTTHSRPDLAHAFGRSTGAFAFVDLAVEPGLELRAGPEGGGLHLGRVMGDSPPDRLRHLRAEARTVLLAGGAPSRSLSAREAMRAGAVEEARADGGTRLRWESGPARPATAATPTEAVPDRTPAQPPRICAIVPVYRGRDELERCVASLLPQLVPGRIRLLIVDDASPDPEVKAWLGSAAPRLDGVTILVNAENRGFIGTVNRGFAALEPGEDAIIVNSDTVLPPEAIARLARHCHARPGVASVTPMSNNATILSFPSTRLRNGALLDLPVEELDRAFARSGTGAVEVPTAIGFCMYLRREALDEVGPFSPEWGRGYCEEVDWSLIARDLGWIHLAATDIFVEHEGSVSFGSAERLKILADNHARLEAKYPEYVGEVMDVVAADPFEPVRRRVLAACLGQRFDRLTLHVMHGLGGGTKRYVDDLLALPREAGHEVGVMTPFADETGGVRLRLSFDTAAASIEIAPESFTAMLDDMEAAGLAVVLHVNSRLTYASRLLEEIAAGSRPYHVTLHDYQWYCPKVHLIDERVFYCDEPPPEICQLCVRHRETHDFGDHNAVIQANIEDWIAFNRRFLAKARSLIAPSQDTAARYRARLGLTNIVVQPHPERAAAAGPTARPPADRRAARSASGGLRIAVIGAIGGHKGFDLIVRTAELAERRRMPLFLEVIGYTPDGGKLTRLSNAAVSGAYEPDELPALLREADPDFVFLPSVWPETYSYVLSEAWSAGYPVVAFDFGAQAERIRRDGGGALIRPTRDAGELLAALFEVRGRLPEGGVPAVPSGAPDLDAYYGDPARPAAKG